MKLIFKQRFLSWFDSYDIYDEDGETMFTVQGQLAWGHCFKIFDNRGDVVGNIKQVMLTLLPRFDVSIENGPSGSIFKELTFFKPRYSLDFMGWQIQGNFLEWDYSIIDSSGNTVATITKEFLNWTDTYIIDVESEVDALAALMVVVSIDAEKCSRN